MRRLVPEVVAAGEKQTSVAALADVRRTLVDLKAEQERLRRDLAAEAGFSSGDQTVIAAAISEIAHNILMYAKRGEVMLSLVTNADRQGVLVDAVSQGAITTFTFNAVSAGHTIAASFDPDRIRRVLRDLIENACQALGELPSYYERRVVVRTGVAPGMVVLTVADTGPGIAPENLDRIFDPLFSTKSFGTGLGLPIVKQIVEQHGGTIRIDSEVAHGTRVRICLPLAADAMPELRRAAA